MRTSRIFWSLLLLFLSLTAAARAQGDRDSLAAATTIPVTVQTAGGNSLAAVEQVWDAANTAYINSDYHRAIDAYRQLILRGYASDKLYYNLANAYFKVGRYGKAILYYNRALRLAPGDADIRYNLDVANTFTKDKIAVVPEFFLKGWVRSVRMSLGCTAWSVVSLAALALMISYLYAYNDPTTDLVLNIINPLTLAGAIIGAALPFLFSGMLIEAVAKAARKMVEEVRRQFKTIPGILEGKARPDYKTCISISTKGAIGEMKVPALLAIVLPVACGFIAGPEFVGGLIIGSTLCSIMIAIFTGNAGGAWDNGKKHIEQGGVEGAAKGDEVHAAAVVGDTVGDPLKDTVGPCLDIFIKIMSTVSLVAVAVFSKYNLFGLFF